MTMLNTCKCGGEVHLDYQQGDYTGQYWYAICNDCGTAYPLKADNRLDAVREWNGCKGVGEVLTNEEWFISLSTKEKARWLYDHYVNARTDEYYGRQEKTLSEYQKWLVSVHRGIDGTKID